MSLKVLQINQVLNTISGNKNGKDWKIYQWSANIELNGSILQSVIKSYNQIDFSKEKEFEKYERKEYHNPNTGNIEVSYFIAPSQKKQWGSSRPSYTIEEYDLLWRHALNKFRDFSENKQEYISTYIISACQAGVKVSTANIEKKIDEVSKNLDKVIDPVLENPYNGDENIPF